MQKAMFILIVIIFSLEKKSMLSILFVSFIATCINLGYYSFTCMNKLPIPYQAKVSNLYICNNMHSGKMCATNANLKAHCSTSI